MAPIDPGNRRGRYSVGDLEPQRKPRRSGGRTVTRTGLRLCSADSIGAPTAEAERGDADREQRPGNENAFVPQWDVSATILVLLNRGGSATFHVRLRNLRRVPPFGFQH